MLPDADPDHVYVLDRDRRSSLGSQRRGGDPGELFGRDGEQHVRHQVGEPALQPDGARVAPGLVAFQRPQVRRGELVGPVLEQPREQQIAGLQQGQILLILDLAGWQQAGRLEVEQGGRHHQELGRLTEVPGPAQRPDVGDELVGDPRERDLGHVELVLGDEREQQVERSLEVRQPDLERRGSGAGALGSRTVRVRVGPSVPGRCAHGNRP